MTGKTEVGKEQKGKLAKTGQAETNTGIIGVGLSMLATIIKRRKKR